MALESNALLGQGGAGFQGGAGQAGSAAAMIKELQGLTQTLVNGAAANTNIAVSGITTEDTIVSVIEYIAGVPTNDRTAATSITSNGNIQCTAATTSNKLIVLWFNKK